MEYSSLYELIQALEYGTKLHIGVHFEDNFGSSKCIIPHEHQIHSKSVCDGFKSTPQGFSRCYRCRCAALKKAADTRLPFGGLCVNGIYEYTSPVIVDGKVFCTIFIGNILTEQGLKKLKKEKVDVRLLEPDYSEYMCKTTAGIVESCIRMLLEKHPSSTATTSPLVSNIKDFILSNTGNDISVKSMSDLFHYNGIYLGRVFKNETGKTIKEYINEARLQNAAEMLKNGDGDTVLSVSQSVGYNNVTYFNRIFKKRFGMTPTEYKNTDGSKRRTGAV